MSSSVSSNPPPATSGPWRAPVAPVPIRAQVRIPGSKSETNRALVLAALSAGPSTIHHGLDARDTQLMRAGLRALGVTIEESGSQWRVTPPDQIRGGQTIDCGLAGTVLRFLPAVALLADGPVSFYGDQQAQRRPITQLLNGLAGLGAEVSADELPFSVTGPAVRAQVTIDSSASSQFISGLLLVGARLPKGLDLRHAGNPLPSLPHIAMTIEMLRSRGVEVDDQEPDRWLVRPGEIAATDIKIEPDLSNAAPFLAAAAITGGEVRVPDWPTETHQPGARLPHILRQFGADVTYSDAGELITTGTDEIDNIEVNLRDASELTPVVAAIAALASRTSHIRGVGHIRGHETDRLAAIAAELEGLGCRVHINHDGLTIHPRLLSGSTWRTYADHRMAQAGALLGLVVDDIVIDDLGCTDKTLPEFGDLWEQMIADSIAESDAEIAAVQAATTS